MAKESVQEKLKRVRPPRVNITYEVGGLITPGRRSTSGPIGAVPISC